MNVKMNTDMSSNLSSNISNKFVLRKDVLNKLKDSNVLVQISADSGVNFNTLKRQVNENHEYLTLYKVLASISKNIGRPIDKLLKPSKA